MLLCCCYLLLLLLLLAAVVASCCCCCGGSKRGNTNRGNCKLTIIISITNNSGGCKLTIITSITIIISSHQHHRHRHHPHRYAAVFAQASLSNTRPLRCIRTCGRVTCAWLNTCSQSATMCAANNLAHGAALRIASNATSSTKADASTAPVCGACVDITIMHTPMIIETTLKKDIRRVGRAAVPPAGTTREGPIMHTNARERLDRIHLLDRRHRIPLRCRCLQMRF